ncbi:lysylphosphatidylglycerol synthase domain-containing protein [Georgenia muralis]
MTDDKRTGRARPWLRPLITYTFYALLLVFLGLYLANIDYSRLGEARFSWTMFLVATTLALSFRYWGAFIWTQILRSLGARDVRYTADLVHVYAKSWLGRYIPGTAPWILGKIFFAAQHGISKNKLAVSSLLEAALQIIVQFLFALVLLVFDPRLDIIPPTLKALIVVALVGCLAALAPPVFNRFIGLSYRIVRKKEFPREHQVQLPTLARGFGLYVLGALLSSLSLFFAAKTVFPGLAYSDIFFVMGVSTLAGAVSMLAVFAPGGIGVREGIQIALLSVIMPTEYAFIIAVFTRVHGVFIDLLFFGLSVIGARSPRRTRSDAAT